MLQRLPNLPGYGVFESRKSQIDPIRIEPPSGNLFP
jgi:hypothetical protein